MLLVLTFIVAIAFALENAAYSSGGSFDYTNSHVVLVNPEENAFSTKTFVEPEAKMDVVEMIRYNGYPAEEYDVTTVDGYILTIQRIPYGKSGPGDKPRQPVIIQHGMLCTSILWVFNTPPKSLAFILADLGYDVWLTNVRGNTYGRRHLTLSPNNKEFWEFSFDEMGRYDMPAMIDFILDKTGFSQTNYIGHSMGTTLAFIMFTERPEYNYKVRSAMLMAPDISVEHMKSPLTLLKPFMNDVQFLVNLIGGYEVVPYSPLNKFLSVAASAFCNSPIKEICEWLPFILSGFDAEQFNVTRFPIYAAQTPGGASVQTIMHYGQLMNPGFRRYNYGKTKNMKLYGQPTPPFYNMNNITLPIALYWSDSDINANPTDVAALAPQIQNLVLKYRVPFTKFTHEDFVFALDAKALVYDKVIEVMKKLWPQDE